MRTSRTSASFANLQAQGRYMWEHTLTSPRSWNVALLPAFQMIYATRDHYNEEKYPQLARVERSIQNHYKEVEGTRNPFTRFHYDAIVAVVRVRASTERAVRAVTYCSEAFPGSITDYDIAGISLGLIAIN